MAPVATSYMPELSDEPFCLRLGEAKVFPKGQDREVELRALRESKIEWHEQAISDDDRSLCSSESEVEPGPDIEWIPSLETYQARVMRLSSDRQVEDLPDLFPDRVSGPRVWYGSDFASEESFVVHLTEDDIAEIEDAVKHFKANIGSSKAHLVKKANFKLPNLGPKLEEICDNLHNGRGLHILRGLQPEKYSMQDNVIIYAGVTSYIGETRGLQGAGHPMSSLTRSAAGLRSRRLTEGQVHIRDAGKTASSQRQSPYSNVAQPFHNDMCDILALYMQSTSAEGGESLVASTAAVYNEIAAARPDVIRTLSEQNWVWDKHQEPAFWELRSLLFDFKGHGPGFCFSRRPLTGSPTSPRGPGVPPMTEVQAEAIDMVHFTAARHALTIKLQRGDIQLVNNFAVFHGRNGFVDSPAEKRHALRLWLRNRDRAWPTPASLQPLWNEIYGHGDDVTPFDITAERLTREDMISRRRSCS